MSRVDLMSAPVVIELYPKDSPDYIDVECTGPERAKIADMSVDDAVKYAMEHYCRRSTLTNAIKEELDEIMGEGEAIYGIYGHCIGRDYDKDGKVIADHTNDPINNKKYWNKQFDEDKAPFWLCEIRMYPQIRGFD